MRICCLIVFLSSHLLLNAQTPYNADSVEKIFKTLPDSIRIREANNLMKFYMDVNFEKSTYYAKQAFDLVDKVENKADVAYTYVSWAIAQYNYGDYEACLAYNFKALEIYQTLADTVKMATVFNNISGVSNAMGDYSSAVFYAYKAYLIHTSRQNWRKAAISCINLSSSYYESKDYDASITWARKGYRYYQTAEQPEELGYAIQMFTDAFIAQKNIDSALYYVDHVAHLLKSHPNEYLETVNQTQRGEVLTLLGKYDSAIIMHTKCMRFYEEMEMPDAVLHTRLSVARAYAGLKDWNKAEQFAMHAHRRSMEIRNKLMIVKSSALLAEIFNLQGKFGRALEHSQIASVYKDSIMAQSLRGSIEGRFVDVKLERETQARLAALTSLEQSNIVISNQWKAIIAVTTVLLITALVAYGIRRVGKERQRMNEKLLRSNLKLNELNHEINGLVNTIVHDLKSPLNSVQGLLSLIQLSEPANKDVGDLICMANKSLANGHEIIRQLLELREVEENAGHTNVSEIDVEELARELYESFHVMARQKNINLVVNSEPCKFISDEIKLRRILDNLVSNALKFSRTGAAVTVNATCVDRGAVFTIEDQGPGFSSDDLMKIYGKFQKLSARPTGGEHSNGLGLATVQALVKNLNAKIHLQTEPGKGSVFTITMPATY